jgi:hypothetical protein
MNIVCVFPIAFRKQYDLFAFLLEGKAGFTATVTSIPEFVTVTGGRAPALTADNVGVVANRIEDDLDERRPGLLFALQLSEPSQLVPEDRVCRGRSAAVEGHAS